LRRWRHRHTSLAKALAGLNAVRRRTPRARFTAMIVGGFATGVVTRSIRPAEAAPEDVRIADLDWVDARRDRRVPTCCT
jgi:hypothetical protein